MQEKVDSVDQGIVCDGEEINVLKENINKEEKIKGLNFQLNRQIESYQSLYADTDRKIATINAKFVTVDIWDSI